MAVNINLTDLASLENATTAINTINNNNAAIEAAFEDVLSREGDTPNYMDANLDMNNNRILNLPSPVNGNEPLRLQDANTLNGGGTISVVPAGGTTGQSLTKTSNADYAFGWSSAAAGVAAGTNIVLTGSGPTTISTSPTPSFSTVNGVTITPTTGTINVANSKTLAVNNTISLSGTDSTSFVLPAVSDTLVSVSGTQTLTNKSISGNQINSGTVPAANQAATNLATSGNGGVTGNLPVTNLNSGTSASSTTYWRGDGTWASPGGSGTVTGPVSSTVNNVALWNNTGGTIIKDSTIPVAALPTSVGNLPGVTTNSNASAGNVGEVFVSTILQASAIGLTSTVQTNITSIALTAGDWDLSGVQYWLVSNATTMNIMAGSFSTTSATYNSACPFFAQSFPFTGNGNIVSMPFATIRVSLASPTTYYLVAAPNFTGGTGVTAFGSIYARRMR